MDLRNSSRSEIYCKSHQQPTLFMQKVSMGAFTEDKRNVFTIQLVIHFPWQLYVQSRLSRWALKHLIHFTVYSWNLILNTLIVDTISQSYSPVLSSCSVKVTLGKEFVERFGHNLIKYSVSSLAFLSCLKYAESLPGLASSNEAERCTNLFLFETLR